MLVGLCAALGVAGGRAGTAGEGRGCEIRVVERGTGWPVPLVELRTTHQVRWVTDNGGRIAFDLPELMGREVWFDVVGHGYEVPKDGFGYRGVRLVPEAGKVLTVEVDRAVVARRLGRLTGAGLFGESQKLGWELDRAETGVLGCDSVQVATHRGRLFWLWGDTTLARYPLGIFNASGAWTSLTPLARWEPPLEVKYDLFVKDAGLPRGIADIPGDGPTWLSALASLPDERGEPHLVATYAKIKPPLEAYEWGLTEWDPEAERFKPVRRLWRKDAGGGTAPKVPEGHAAFWTDAEGRRWVLFGNPFPALQSPATYEAWQDTNQWRVLSPQAELAAAGANSARPMKPHTGSIAWNGWRNRWVTVFMEAFGKPSTFGELWYAEAKSPFGPWGPAVKVLSHENYTFYNPRVHPELAPPEAKFLLFEGTYTIQFSDNKQPTPRYDYNQILYLLPLDDPALAPAQSSGD